MKITDKPDLYDLLYEDVTEDIKLYKKLLKDSKNILEFGCGTGRVTIPLAEEKHKIEAVDISEKMLNGLKDKINKSNTYKEYINPVLGDMCNYVSSKRFDAVIVPLTSFNYLLTEKEQINCLKTIEKNLKKNGIAIIELLSKNTFIEVNNGEDYKHIKNISLDECNYYKYYRKTYLNHKTKEITQQRLFELYENNNLISNEIIIWNNRFVTIEDFKKILKNTSLSIDKIYGNCNLEVYNDNSEDVFIVLRNNL